MKAGDRVRLRERLDLCLPEQKATVLGVDLRSQTAIVDVDGPPFEDNMQEVDLEDIILEEDLS